MREIKFRAWDPEENRMFYPDSISFDEEGGIGCLFQHNNLPDDTEIISGYSKCKLMQFTGLLDKKGVEIYEGDVVKMHQFLFDGTEVEREHTGIVAFDEELAAFNFTYIRGEFYSEHTGYEDGTDSEGSPICLFYGLHEESFEVIGNTYANPELLGKDTHAE